MGAEQALPQMACILSKARTASTHHLTLAMRMAPVLKLGFPAILGLYTAAQELLKTQKPQTLSRSVSATCCLDASGSWLRSPPSAGGCLQGSLQLRSLGTRQAHEAKEPG